MSEKPKKRDGGWSNYTQEQREQRIKVATAKRVATMNQNRIARENASAKKKASITLIPAAKAQKSLEKVIEGVFVGKESESLDALAKLIIATWRNM